MTPERILKEALAEINETERRCRAVFDDARILLHVGMGRRGDTDNILRRVRIKADWIYARREGTVIGLGITSPIGQHWTPVKWDSEDDPDWFKTAGLEDIK